jgi:pimeloyl-ACP methyl ester carboxylesterase
MTGTRQWSGPGLQRITVHGLTVAVETVRNGSPARQTIAWVHGLGGASTRTFASITRDPALAGVHSLLIDLPGHGQSDRPSDWSYAIEDLSEVVIRVLRAATTDPVVLFGHSMGGSVAIEAARRAPEAFRTLIVAEPNLDPGIGTTSSLIAAQREETFVATGHGALVRTARLSQRRVRSGSLWPETLGEASPVALHRSAVSLLADRDPTFRAQAEALSIPVAVIRGEHGDQAGASLTSPTIVHHVVAGAGHEMWVDNREGFLAAIRTVLASDDAQPTG